MRNYLLKQKTFLLALALIFCATLVVNAQSRTVTGTVMDPVLGESVPGATVLVKGSTRGVATDLDGKFSIDLQPGDQVHLLAISPKRWKLAINLTLP